MDDRYIKAVKTRDESHAARKLRVFEPLIKLMLEGAELSTNQMSDMYGMHRSTGRSYREQMERARVVKVSRAVRTNNIASENLYVIDDPDRAREFVDNLRAGINCSRTSRALIVRGKAGLLPGSHVHLAIDDQEVPLRKVCNEHVNVQRHWMDLALFGEGPAPSLMDGVVA